MLLVGWYLLKRHGEKEYDLGIIEAIQLHNEGRLTYDSYINDEGIEMIDIEVRPNE